MLSPRRRFHVRCYSALYVAVPLIVNVSLSLSADRAPLEALGIQTASGEGLSQSAPLSLLFSSVFPLHCCTMLLGDADTSGLECEA